MEFEYYAIATYYTPPAKKVWRRKGKFLSRMHFLTLVSQWNYQGVITEEIDWRYVEFQPPGLDILDGGGIIDYTGETECKSLMLT